MRDSRLPGRRDLGGRAHITLRRIWLLGLFWLPACQPAAPHPVEIAPEDMCAFCKMAISEKRFAAEIIPKDGEPLKFDDIGCMIRYMKIRQNRGEITAVFVVDYETREWLKAEEAHYVRSSQLTTPMSSGIVAYREKAQADTAVAKYRGELLRFADLRQRAWEGER